ncbi:MAG TPA: metalloregulator ArsR/SmtB family transcription factor [Microlunatus sp.]|nr:metalloregulator ArsR/SmtB family transcription factor [Microlunatus sp.]
MAVSVFEAVAEPNRRRILAALRERDHSVGDLVQLLGITQPAVSKHLKALRAAGLVVVRPEAQRRWYRLRSEPLQDLDAWLEPYRRTWAQRLDALGDRLDAMSADPDEAGSAAPGLPADQSTGSEE